MLTLETLEEEESKKVTFILLLQSSSSVGAFSSSSTLLILLAMLTMLFNLPPSTFSLALAKLTNSSLQLGKCYDKDLESDNKGKNLFGQEKACNI